MLKDRFVRVKMRKSFREQRPISYVGKVTAFNDFWLVLAGKMVMVCRNQSKGVQVDAKPANYVIPRDNVEAICVLPDTFDINDIEATTDGQQFKLIVKNGTDCYLGELGEG
jgi:hypothetical protein